MHRNCQLLFENYVSPRIGESSKVLEVGPGAPSWYKDQMLEKDFRGEWLYADIEEHDLDQDINSFNRVNPIDVLIEQGEFKYPDDSMDVVFSASVIEHAKYIWEFFKECSRILKQGGLFGSVSSISWPYHEAPVDCWRIHPEGMRALLELTELEEEVIKSECLEYSGSRIVPGCGRDFQSFRQKPRYDLGSLVGNQVEAAIDMVTMATKQRLEG